jgi:hypothetical protein
MRRAGKGLDFWIAAADDGLEEEVMRLASELRAVGASVEYSLRPQSLGKQYKAAGAAGAPPPPGASGPEAGAGAQQGGKKDDVVDAEFRTS